MSGQALPLGIAQVLRDLPPRSTDPNLLIGTETSDDAGVYLLPDGSALVQTLDFFPPLVDDPYVFGQIAAANALSDVYAMNGRPLTAMNIVGFPDNELPLSVLAEILNGSAERVAAAGAVTVGGHSVRDAEVKFGLSVTGIVAPSEILTNAGARVGDLLVLTKPLGTGFITTANKKGECPSALLAEAVASMISLNVIGRDAARSVLGVHAMTDVTGFGLAGHASEMAEGAGVTIRLRTRDLPRFAGIGTLLNAKYHSRASRSNREFLGDRCRIEEDVEADGVELAFDPQTSGGLLIAIEPEGIPALVEALRAGAALASSIVGEVLPREASIAIVMA